MYDGGNYISVHGKTEDGTPRWEFELPYTQDCQGLFPAPTGIGDITYATCKLMDGAPHALDSQGDVTSGTLFAAVFSSRSASIDGLLISGDLGADDYGHSWALNATGPRGVRAYYKEIYGAGTDPSISHLILARGALKYASLSTTTNSDFQYVRFHEGQALVVYLLWAGKEPTAVPGLDVARSFKFGAADVQRVIDAVAPSCFGQQPPASLPPSPPPPPPMPPATRDCARACRGKTCLAFREVSCRTIRQPPWGCDCGDCCAADTSSSPPPPPPPPDFPASPPPLPPAACDKTCAGATCGAFLPYTCDAFSEVLGCDCGGCCETPLDAQCVNEAWPANLPSLYSFTSGTMGYTVSDGGDDMFDNGNELRIRVNGQWSSPLYYTQVCDGASANGVFFEDKWTHRHDGAAFDAKYLTCKLEQYDAGYGAVFVLVVESKAGSIDGFQVTGNLGADGSGKQESNDGGSPLHGPKGAVGYYKATYGAGGTATTADPSVNHLVFGPGADGAKVSVGATTDNDS